MATSIGVTLAALSAVWGSAGPDAFSPALPARDTVAPETRAGGAGAASVLEQTGAASYSFPVVLPPGRGGMAPSLALSYSSQSPLRGGIAVGWSLPMPTIEKDPDVLDGSAYVTGGSRLDPFSDDPGAGQRFRAETDGGYARYEFNAEKQQWTARTLDGVLHRYQRHVWGTRWHLTQEVDPFGNQVDYKWTWFTAGPHAERQYGEWVLESIEYTSNEAAGLKAHARVDFVRGEVETCGGIPVGASVDHHFALRMSGGRRLDAIRVYVRDDPQSNWRLSRNTQLLYDENEEHCDAAALRYLTRIDVTGYDAAGVGTSQPPVTFAYGPKRRELGEAYDLKDFGGGELGNSRGPTSTLIDLDDDGWIDRVTSVEEAWGCSVDVQRGIGIGLFDPTATRISLPSLPWYDGIGPNSLEGCTLSSQLVYRGTHDAEDGNAPCRVDSAVVSYHFRDWDGDGLVDLLSSLHETSTGNGHGDFPDTSSGQQQCGFCPIGTTQTGCANGAPTCTCTIGEWNGSTCGACEGGMEWNPWAQQCETPECGAPCDGDGGGGGGGGGGGDGGGGGGGGKDDERCEHLPPEPQQEANSGLYLFYVQHNLGDVAFAPFSEALHVRSPAPLPPNPLPADVGQVARPGVPTLSDVTGDGFLDILALNDPPSAEYGAPDVPGDEPYLYVWPGNGTDGFGAVQTWGLPPWEQALQANSWDASTGTLAVHGTVELRDLNGDGLPDFVAQRPFGDLLTIHNFGTAFLGPVTLELSGPVDHAQNETAPWTTPPRRITTGQRGFVRQMVDVDADGLPEQLYMPPVWGVLEDAQLRVAYRIGAGTLFAADLLGAEWEALESAVQAKDGWWHRYDDAIDVNGDGLPDMVTWETLGGPARMHTDRDPDPLRLMTSVDNGRGSVTRFWYAPSTAPGFVEMGDGHLSARHLVRQIHVDAGQGAPLMTTSYAYAEPYHGPDGPLDTGTPDFRGFRRVTIERSGQLGPSSSRTVKHYGYQLPDGDWGGRLQSTWNLSLQTSGGYEPIGHTSQTWQFLMGVTVPDTTVVRSCSAGASMADCLASPAGLSTTSETWKPYRAVANGAVLHYQHAATRTEVAGLTPRVLERDFTVRTTEDEYRQVETQVKGGDEWTVMSRTITLHDSRLLPIETWRYQDAFEISTTKRDFDAVGNLIREMRPSQVAGNGQASSISYGPHLLYPDKIENELGHVIVHEYDIATGGLIARFGPNRDDVAEWTIDGLGRVLEHRGSTAPTGQVRVLDRYAYVDSVPNRVHQESVQDHATGAVISGETTYDGLGRVVRRVDHRQIAGAPDANTAYRYDAAGALVELDQPNPADDGSMVTYRWMRDGSGRTTATIRPDGSGEDVAYDGLRTTVTERSPLATRTTTVRDAFGDLREVWEHPLEKPTRYGYDALGRVTTIQDGADAVTSFAYDMQDHRIVVKRGSRAWQYFYDLDGNPVAELAPVPQGSLGFEYTSWVEYDALGRVVRREPATAGIGPAERARLGIGTTTYEYDVGQIGTLSTMQLPFATVAYKYDVEGRLSLESRKIQVPETDVAVEQWVEREYDAMGAPRSVTWDDGTHWGFEHDPRGMVEAVRWRSPGGSMTDLARYRRRVAGAPYERRSSYTQRRDWTYDELGRVRGDRIWDTATNATYGERAYGYDGDEIVEVWGWNDGLVADASYTYDVRHRLTGAIGPGNYRGGFEYGPTGNIEVSHVQGAIDVPDRDVAYEYASFDPQAVARLVDLQSGDSFAKMEYDLAGNLIRRSGQGGDLELVFDGEEQLREVRAGSGRETYLFGPGAERMVAVGDEDVKVWFDESETHFQRSGSQLRRWHHVATGEAVARIEGERVELQYGDVMSNLMLAIGTDGDVTASFLYGAFGELVASSGSDDHRRQFNGKENDEVSGLRHYGFRSYDPLLLRWISADPAYRFSPDAASAEPQRANLYAFSLNNAMRWVDPDGLDGEDAGVPPAEGGHDQGGDSTPCESVAGPTQSCSQNAGVDTPLEDYEYDEAWPGKLLMWVFEGTASPAHAPGNDVKTEDFVKLAPPISYTDTAIDAGGGAIIGKLGRGAWRRLSRVGRHADDAPTSVTPKPDVAPPSVTPHVGSPDLPTEFYNRKKHYGRTPTRADRKALGAGSNTVADHDPPLVIRYYFGDPKVGEKPGFKMTPEERIRSANDRTRMHLQPKVDSHRQGAAMSWASKQIRAALRGLGVTK